MNSNLCKIILRLQNIRYGSNLTLKGIPVIFNQKGARLTIGNNVTIKSSFLSNLVGLYSRTIICTRTPEAEIVIGNNVGISGVTLYSRKGIYIGDNTCIGGNTKIMDNDFHPIDYETRNKLSAMKHGADVNDFIPSKAITIGNNCFIGCNAIILKGTILGDGCVVGAGAVVSGVFETGTVIGGNPAKVIKKLKV